MNDLDRSPAGGSEYEPSRHNDTPALQTFALGPEQVLVRGRPLRPSDWTFAKPRELLFYLLTFPGSSKQQIGLDLWPAASTAQLRNSFHTALHHLRRGLGEPTWIAFRHGRYELASLVDYFYDVDQFEAGLAAARAVYAQKRSDAIPHLQAALALNRGDFLPEFSDSDWVRRRQDDLQRQFHNAMLTLGALLQEDGHNADAADVYRRAIARDPLSETAHRELMRCELKLGERGHAIRQYERLVEKLREEFDAPPAPETTSLYLRLRRGDPEL